MYVYVRVYSWRDCKFVFVNFPICKLIKFVICYLFTFLLASYVTFMSTSPHLTLCASLSWSVYFICYAEVEGAYNVTCFLYHGIWSHTNSLVSPCYLVCHEKTTHTVASFKSHCFVMLWMCLENPVYLCCKYSYKIKILENHLYPPLTLGGFAIVFHSVQLLF